MASNVPTVRQVAWIAVVPHLAIIGLLMFLYYKSGVCEYVYAGAFTFLGLKWILGSIVLRKNKQGIRLVKRQRYMEAVPYFEESLSFFERYPWLDKYRYVVVLSSSGLSYKEMALCNLGFCYSQTGQGDKAKAYYEQVLREFPNNGLAKAALNMIHAFAIKNEIN